MGSPFSLRRRSSGILLHPTSLPGPHGVGDLGPSARRFADFLASCRQRWWQMLPVVPPAAGNSPYTAFSAFAGNPLLLSPELLAEAGWLSSTDAARAPNGRPDRVDYARASRDKEALFEKAFAAFDRSSGSGARGDFEQYCARDNAWIEDYALFCAIKEERRGAPWTEWEPDLRARKPAALAKAAERLRARSRYHKFLQFEFHRQWSSLREHCGRAGVGLMGDVPIYVAHDSAEVWARPDLFLLGEEGRPTVVAGVPPDYFSATGQLWGNPIYRWDCHRQEGYEWWLERFRRTFERFDAARLDHFIGFQRYWEVPARDKTAQNGRWNDGPGAGLFEAALKALGPLELVAEDLGAATPEVYALRDRFELPGMRVLQFAFGGGPGNPNLPHHYPRRCVAYTGTHDNDTSSGWLKKAPAREREFARRYMGGGSGSFARRLIRLAWSSVADTAVAPAQDLLGLGTSARMNLPGTALGNWEWRLSEGALDGRAAERLAEVTETYGRA